MNEAIGWLIYAAACAVFLMMIVAGVCHRAGEEQ